MSAGPTAARRQGHAVIRLQRVELRLLRHVDRLGDGHCEALRPLSERSGTSADRLLEAYGPVEHAIEIEQPGLLYSRLLERVHERLSRAFGVDPDELAAAKFGASVGDWPAFPDSAEALRIPQAAFQADHPLERRQAELCREQPAAWGWSSTTSSPPRISAPTSPISATSNFWSVALERDGIAEGPAPPRRPEPVPRPRPGEPDRSCVGVDRSPRGQGGIGSDGRARSNAALRFPLHVAG